MKIFCEHNPSPAKLDVMGVYDWPIWSKEVSTFPWTYEQKETCYILEGEAIVTPDDGSEPVHLQAGDLVTFVSGLSCTWDIKQDIQKHYDFG